MSSRLTRVSRPQVLAAIALAVTLVASACGGGDGASITAGSDAAHVAEQPETQKEPATVDEADDSDNNSGSDSDTNNEAKTLDEYLGAAAGFARGGGGAGGGRGGGQAGGEDQAEQARLVQVEIQRCMQQQGFTYFPEEQNGARQIFVRPDAAGLSAEDYAATEGFGISTRFDALLEGDVDLSEDPSDNEDHLATLSDGEVEAWQFALRGAPPERNDQGQLIDPETGEVIQGQGRGRIAGGCSAEAQTTVRGDFTALQQLSDEFAELDDRIDADPRISQIRREWSTCMRERGFDFEEPADARREINSELQPLIRSLFRRGPNAANDGAISLSPEQESELKVLQDRERSIAVASFECDGDTDAEVEAIVARYEAEFVEQNRSALEAFGG